MTEKNSSVCPHPACPAGVQATINISQHDEIKGNLESIQNNQKEIQAEVRGVSETISKSMTQIAVSFEKISNINDKMESFIAKVHGDFNEVFTRLRGVESSYISRTELYTVLVIQLAVLGMIAGGFAWIFRQ
jgi:hypothetical protein